MTPEGKVKAKVNRLLDRHGAYRFMPVQTGYGARTLDYLLCHRSRFLAVETKAPGKKPTRIQKLCMEKIEAAGGKVFLIDGVNGQLEELERYLKGDA